MAERRPNPEELLEQVKAEENREARGKLKIFFGAAPGVGKTHAMLEDAKQRRATGLDVVIGIVESHGRKEIENLLQGLEILPRAEIEYKGKKLLEFDLDAALTRRPQLIIVDEMAHTNAPECRHTKRWQDIKELLDRGIDVYTALNVQHVESLNDIVAQITGVRVRETVSDSILELADTIELIDLPPDDLLKRMQEGKVYFPAQAELAAQHFFRKSNLTALRELALRYTAEQVNTQVLFHRRGEAIEKTWPTAERLLVCVGPKPASAKLIRAAKRMAANLHAEWIAVSVETPKLRLSAEEQQSIIQNLRLAEQLGAETKSLTGRDVVKEIIDFARSRNVTKIVMQKQIRSRWKDLLFGSLVDELVRHSGEIDIYIIRSDIEEPKRKKLFSYQRTSPWSAYLMATLIVAFATFVNFFLYRHIALSNLIMVYLLAIIIVAIRGQRGPSVLASILSVLLYDFFFIPPRYSFSVSDTQYLITLIVMLLVTQIISHLAILTRQQAEIARLREQRASALHALSRQLASHRGVEELLTIAVRYVAEVFDSQVLALLADAQNHLNIHVGYHAKLKLSSKEFSIAQWVFDMGQNAGFGTHTLPFSEAIYIPLLGSQGTVGVLRVKPAEPQRLLLPEQLHLLETCAQQIALALEVDRLQEQARKTQIEIENERLRNALLSSVSHDLRTPLAAIMGSAGSLLEMHTVKDEKAVYELVENIYEESERLNRLINNLLQAIRLEAGKIELHKEAYSLEEIIGVALNRLEKILGNKPVKINMPENLPMIPMDNVLMEQVFINLIENAIRYTPSDTPIEISAVIKWDHILVKVVDHGSGLAPEEIERIFEKFYRGKVAKKESGAGLGLAICQSIIKAHGGKIWAENRNEGGAIFYFTLPKQTH